MRNAMVASAQAERPAVQPLNCLLFYRKSPIERVEFIKKGFSARSAKNLLSHISIDQASMFKSLNIKTATINKKSAQDDYISQSDAERILGIAKLIGQVQAMVEESGDSRGFDAAAWLSRWLREPLPALGRAPLDLLDTMEGQALVSQVLAQMQSGAYA